MIITGTIRVGSEDELARVREALQRRAVKSRKDAGNIDYVFTQNLEDPCEIRLIEKWESEQALNDHLAVPDEEFNTVLGTARIERAIVVSHDTSNERVLLDR